MIIEQMIFLTIFAVKAVELGSIRSGKEIAWLYANSDNSVTLASGG